MRDQGTAFRRTPSIDLLQIDENTSLSPEDLVRIVNGITSPSTEVIEPTFATGQNTKIFISLCQKMISQTKEEFKQTMHDRLDATKVIKSTDTVLTNLHNSAEKSEERTVEEIEKEKEYATVLLQVREAQATRLLATSKYADRMKHFGASVETMIKLGNGLVADQEKYKASIKGSKCGLKYAITCKAIDGQWVALKGDFIKMKELSKTVKRLEGIREGEKLYEGEGEDLADLTIEQVSKMIANAVESGADNAENK